MGSSAEVKTTYRTTELAKDVDDLLDVMVAARDCDGVEIDILPMGTPKEQEAAAKAHLDNLQFKMTYIGWALKRRVYELNRAIENGGRIVELVMQSDQIDGGPNLETFRCELYTKRKVTELHNAIGN